MSYLHTSCSLPCLCYVARFTINVLHWKILASCVDNREEIFDSRITTNGVCNAEDYGKMWLSCFLLSASNLWCQLVESGFLYKRRTLVKAEPYASVFFLLATFRLKATDMIRWFSVVFKYCSFYCLARKRRSRHFARNAWKIHLPVSS